MYISTKDARMMRMSQIVGIAISFSPIFYLAIAIFMSEQRNFPHSEFLELVSFMLLPFAAITPFVFPMLEKAQIRMYRKSSGRKQTPGQLFFSMLMIKFSLAHAAFIYGMIVFFLGGGISRMLYFYPIGMIWAFIFWPRERDFKKFLEQLEAK